MKQLVFSAMISALFTANAGAQVVNDTVTTGQGYANNVWYSLANDDQATAAVNAWDIALSTSMGAADPLTTAVLFNHKLGYVYEIPGSDPADFENADTAGLSTWTPLYNSDETWSDGAFNNTSNLGSFDYGWGTYNMTTHGIEANRIFVIKYNSGAYRKLMISSSNTTGVYTLVFAALDNTEMHTVSVDVASYTSKNFVSYNLLSNEIVDREPASADWDLYFHQYPSFDYNPPYTVSGIFQNAGVQIAKVYPVNDPSTYTDFSTATFQDEINVIGYAWKTFGGMSYVIEDSTVYFVKDKAGDIWKVIMTGFGGSSTGKYMFSKERISEAGLNEQTEMVAQLYPNPANETATLVLDNAGDAQISLYDMSGRMVYTTSTVATQLTAIQLPVSALNSGIYRLVIAAGHSAISRQLSIQH